MQLEPEPTTTPHTRRDAEKLQRRDRYSVQLEAVRNRRCERSFRQLYEYFAPRVSSFLRQKGVEERISHEIMQETMTRVWLKARQFDSQKASASTWIFTIARNLFIDHIRQRRRAEVDPNDPMLVRDEDHGPDAGLDKADRAEILQTAIGALPPEQAEVLRLVYMTGMKQQAVADKLSVPLNTVKSRLRLALEKLRRLMEHA